MNTGTWRTTVGTKIQAGKLPPGSSVRQRVNVGPGFIQSLAYGTGSGYADLFIAKTLVLTPATSTTLDLYGGTDFVDVFGDPANFRAVKSMHIAIDDDDIVGTSGVRIGGAGSNCFPCNFADTSDKALIYPASNPFLCGSQAGITVSSTAKNLKIENLSLAESVTVVIYIAGSAASVGVPMGLGLLFTYP